MATRIPVLFPFILAALVASSAAAQGTVHVVGSGGPGAFPQIQPAVDAARDGDTILVVAGNTYDPFEVTGKGLIIVADPVPADDRAHIAVADYDSITIKAVPAGQSVLLRGFRVAPVGRSRPPCPW